MTRLRRDPSQVYTVFSHRQAALSAVALADADPQEWLDTDQGLEVVSLTQASPSSTVTLWARNVLTKSTTSKDLRVKLDALDTVGKAGTNQFASWKANIVSTGRIAAVKQGRPDRQNTSEADFTVSSTTHGIVVDVVAPRTATYQAHPSPDSQDPLRALSQFLMTCAMACCAGWAVWRYLICPPRPRPAHPTLRRLLTLAAWALLFALIPACLVAWTRPSLNVLNFESWPVALQGTFCVLLWILMPQAVHAASVHRTLGRPPTLRDTAPVILPTICIGLLLCTNALNTPSHETWWAMLWWTGGACLTFVLSKMPHNVFTPWRSALGWGAVSIAPAFALLVPPLPGGFLAWHVRLPALAEPLMADVHTLLAPVAVTLPWAYVVSVLIRQALGRGSRNILLTVGLVPVLTVVVLWDSSGDDWSSLIGRPSLWTIVSDAPDALAALLFPVLFLLAFLRLHQLGQHQLSPTGDILRLCRLVLFAALCWSFSWNYPLLGLQQWDLLAQITLAALSSHWLLPAGPNRTAAALERVSRTSSARLVRLLIRAQALSTERRDFLRKPSVSAADPEAWEEARRRLESQRHRPGRGGPVTRDRRLRAAALGNGLGVAPWPRALQATLVAAVVSAPWALAAYSWSDVSAAEGLLAGFLVDMFRANHWLVFGFVYGYALPWMRGSTPMDKATRLLAVLLVNDLALIPFTGWGWSWTTIGSTVGTSVALCLLLALIWEYTAVRRAGYLWRDVRSFRSAASLAAPTTAVTVAVLTAALTTLATSYSAQLAPPAPPSTAQSSTSGQP